MVMLIALFRCFFFFFKFLAFLSILNFSYGCVPSAYLLGLNNYDLKKLNKNKLWVYNESL